MLYAACKRLFSKTRELNKTVIIVADFILLDLTFKQKCPILRATLYYNTLGERNECYC